MSTYLIDAPPALNLANRCHALRRLLLRVAEMPDLSRPEELAHRLAVLDELDRLLGGMDGNTTRSDFRTISAAHELSSRLQVANDRLYEAARAQIALRGSWPTMYQWLTDLAFAEDPHAPRPGLSFDLLDDILSGILNLRPPDDEDLLQSAEMTAYQPTPVRHVLDLIKICRFSGNDVLVDLGSGLGHVPLLVSILTGIRTGGVEIQPDYVVRAQESAEALNLTRVSFAADDARLADLSTGTVFYLFSPFTDSILQDVLQGLHGQSKRRRITICSLGPCTLTVHQQPWLRASSRPDTERITQFHSQ